jgi:peptide/nickel transport system substrate-binding protein
MNLLSITWRSFTIGLCSVFLASCGNGEEEVIKKENTGEITKAESKFLKIPDATSADPSWKKENIFIYHILSEPDDMHPTNGNSSSRSEINLYTQVFLVNTNYQLLQPLPQLAKAMPKVAENGLEYTYELKDYMKWDDGTALTAEDVIFTFKANKCPLVNNPHAKPYLENIADITIDPSNKSIITIKMKRRYIQNIWFLTDYPIMQRTYFDKGNVLAKYTFAQLDDPKFNADSYPDLKAWGAFFNDTKFGHEPGSLPGAGPYKFEKWDQGQSITLVKKENHWSATRLGEDLLTNANPDKIIMKVNKDPNSQKLDFKNQVFDATTYLDTKTLLDLQADATFNKYFNGKFVDTYNYSYMAMNMQPDGIKHKKIFTDKKVRRAIALLVPYDEINKVVQHSLNKRMIGPVSPVKPDFNTDLKPIPFDPDQAKKLLAEAGWKDTDGDNILDKVIDGEKVKMQFALNYMTTTPTWKNMAEIMAESMLKAGVKVDITPKEFSNHYDQAKNHDFDAMLASWAGSSVPDDFTQIWHSSSWSSKGSNYPGFGNAETDALIDSIKYAIDDNVRVPMVKKLQEKIYDEQPYVFMFAALRRIAVHKRWANQEMYVERPGLLLNNFKLIGTSSKNAAQ